MKRSLILAGGGLKVAFQAGVLQVWLDEARIKFDHADGSSGGVFNLAMYCQGMSGTEIADNWRRLYPVKGIAPNWRGLLKLFMAESLFTLKKYRDTVFPGWGLDWDKIRSTEREATFNVYNFSRHELAVIEPNDMTEDMLAAGVSLPMWFPPVTVDGEDYIDAVYATDANIEEALRRGADELWIIWTVSDRDSWRNGFIANYFQIIEAASNSNFKRVLGRIGKNNEDMQKAGSGEFGRHVEVKLLKSEVPLHYLINFSHDHVAEVVNMGVLAARKWCEQHGIDLKYVNKPYKEETMPKRSVSFTEEMKGFASLGNIDYESGYKDGQESDNRLMFHLTIRVEDLEDFILDPRHIASADGYVECDFFGGRMEVTEGSFNLFVDEQSPATKRMLYRLYFADGQGTEYTLSGYKVIHDDAGLDVWIDTTTLYTRVFKGRVDQDGEIGAEVAATGIIKIGVVDFARQLTTFRGDGPGLLGGTTSILRFGGFFLRNIWDVYVKRKAM